METDVEHGILAYDYPDLFVFPRRSTLWMIACGFYLLCNFSFFAHWLMDISHDSVFHNSFVQIYWDTNNKMMRLLTTYAKDYMYCNLWSYYLTEYRFTSLILWNCLWVWISEIGRLFLHCAHHGRIPCIRGGGRNFRKCGSALLRSHGTGASQVPSRTGYSHSPRQHMLLQQQGTGTSRRVQCGFALLPTTQGCDFASSWDVDCDKFPNPRTGVACINTWTSL